MNGYFEEINGNKYLMLVPTYESKEIMKKCEKLWSKIRNLTTILVIIFRDILMFDKIFVSSQVKRIVIISNKHGIYESEIRKYQEDLKTS